MKVGDEVVPFSAQSMHNGPIVKKPDITTLNMIKQGLSQSSNIFQTMQS